MTTADVIGGTIGTVMVVLPGWCVARACRLSYPLVAGFVGAAVMLMSVVVAIDHFSLPLTFGTVGIAWAALSTVAIAFWFRHRQRIAPAETLQWRNNWPLLVPLVPMVVVVVYRACAQPLFGVDTIFRWNYLAEQMLARGTLAFYPPVTAEDYEIYSWPDGIAPIVSSLYFWIYSFVGAARPPLVSPLLIFQFGLVVLATFGLAAKYFSLRSAYFAAALVACSPLVAWATTMGQETGLTTLAVLALLLYLPANRADESTGKIVFAALAASLGALAREYGLVFPVLGFILCASRRISPRACGAFAAVCVLATAPWYIRTWIQTGNPLFNLPVGFPVNGVHAWLNESYQAEYGWGMLPPESARLVLVNGCAALIGGMAGSLLYFRSARALLVTIALVTGLWALSLHYTAAGFIYSLRVLSPAFAIGALLGGATLGRYIPDDRNRNAVVLGLSLFAMDAALRALTLPANVHRVPMESWLTVGGAVHEYHARPIYAELARVVAQERILVLGPNALLSRQGARTVPLWSPEVRFLFDASIPPNESARRLRSANIGFVLTNSGEVNDRFLARSPFFARPPGELQRVWHDSDMSLFRVHAPRLSQ